MTFADCIEIIENTLHLHYTFVEPTWEADDTVTLRTPCVYCNLSFKEARQVLVIENIQVEPRLRRTGLGIGTTLVQRLIAITQADKLCLQADNVATSAEGFWEQPALGFQRLKAHKKRWQHVPAHELRYQTRNVLWSQSAYG